MDDLLKLLSIINENEQSDQRVTASMIAAKFFSKDFSGDRYGDGKSRVIDRLLQKARKRGFITFNSLLGWRLTSLGFAQVLP